MDKNKVEIKKESGYRLYLTKNLVCLSDPSWSGVCMKLTDADRKQIKRVLSENNERQKRRTYSI